MEKIKKLSNGVLMPRIGLGVWKVDEKNTFYSVKMAIKTGYRLVDTASYYGNETAVGEAIRASEIPRDKLFITTKLWNSDQGYESTLKAFNESLRKLKLDYLDLYLIHWPILRKSNESWRAMEELYQSGKVKAIGVSNFMQQHIETLLTTARIKPMIDQVEIHPTLTQAALRKYLDAEGIAVESWSPLGQGKILNNATLLRLAESYKKSVAQIIIRWHLQSNIIVIPKSIHANRIKENFDVFDFNLTNDDIKKIDALNKNDHLDWDPNSVVFPRV